MAVPQRKTSKSRNKMRQAGKGYKAKSNVFIDANGEYKMSHIVIVKRVKKAKEVKEDDKNNNA